MKSSWDPAYTSLYARFVTRLAEEINFRNFIAHVLRPSKPIFRDFQDSPGHGPEQLAAAEKRGATHNFLPSRKMSDHIQAGITLLSN